MTSGPDSVIVSQNLGPDSTIKGLKDVPLSSTSPDNSIVWKDLGQYLESLNEIHLEGNSKFKNGCNIENSLGAVIEYRACNICNRPILTSHLAKHITVCLEMKQQKEQKGTSNGVSNTGMNGSVYGNDETLSPQVKSTSVPKKRKADSSDTATKKKAKRDGTKPKKKSNAKPKGPVDVERQCGVALPGGGFCARSLTCKTHSMGAKRAVPGRSASYDTLLAAYQHKNQVKIAGQAAKAQAEKDELMHGGLTALDSDEETQQVLGGVSRSFPLPLERQNLVPTRIRTNFLRMREMFAGAILPRITNSNGVGGINGRTALLDIDRSNDHLFLVRAPQRIMLNKNNIQQQSLAQQQANRNALMVQQQRAQQLQQAQAQSQAQSAKIQQNK